MKGKEIKWRVSREKRGKKKKRGTLVENKEELNINKN